MAYRVFYTSYSLQESISSDSPRLLDGAQVEALALRILREEDDFLGVIDNDDRVIQVMRDTADGFVVELPDFDARASLQCRLAAEQALELLATLPGRLRELDLSLFELVPWAKQ